MKSSRINLHGDAARQTQAMLAVLYVAADEAAQRSASKNGA